MPVCHMVLTPNRTLYVTTKAMKKIQKIIVPEDMSSATVTRVFEVIYFLQFFNSYCYCYLFFMPKQHIKDAIYM